MANLSSRKVLTAATTAIRIAARLEHPMKQVLEDAETYMTSTPRNQTTLDIEL
jgi:hypothetical protein